MSYERTIERIVENIRDAKDRGKGCTLLIGAGCSVTAGIPLASGFVNEIEKRYCEAYKDASLKTYPHCMGQLSFDQRRDLIESYVKNAKINWAHICIALLMKEGYVDRVLTTNFDPLVVRACALIGEYPAVYDFAASKIMKLEFLPAKAIIYLHGQHSGFVLINTPDETSDFNELIKPVIEMAGGDHLWIVVGYSGENDPVFDDLAGIKNFDNSLYWIGYKDNEPPSHVYEKLLTQKKDAHFVKGYDADSFFIALTQKLGIFPPDLIQKPFSYLGKTFELLTEWPLSDTGSTDVTRDAKNWIAEAIVQFENTQSVSVKAQTLLMEGKDEEVISLLGKIPDPLPKEAKKTLAWAYILRGNKLYLNAQNEKGSEKIRLYANACENYKNAASASMDMHEAYYNWGLALSACAKLDEGADSDRLYTEAYEKYALSVKYKIDNHEAYYNWGIALFGQAKLKEGTESDKLYKESYEKYGLAVKYKEDHYDTYYNWGNALLEQANSKEGTESDRLFKESYEKYALAVKYKADFPEAYSNWGATLNVQAKLKEGAESVKLYKDACEKCALAVKHKAECHEAYNNWGSALRGQAKLKTGAESDRLYTEAYEKYALSVKYKIDKHETYYNWGNVLSEQAKLKTGAESDRLYTEAYEKYALSVKYKIDMHEAYGNWGLALSEQAKLKTGAESDKLFMECYEKNKLAVKYKADDFDAYNNWGAALSEQAKMKEGTESDRLYTEAIEKYALSVKYKIDNHEAYNNWGIVLLEQAKKKEGNERRRLFLEANSILQKAEKIEEGSESYNLACVSALMGNENDCKKWLQKSKEKSMLPSLKHLNEDKDLDSVRDKQWFKDLIKDVK